MKKTTAWMIFSFSVIAAVYTIDAATTKRSYDTDIYPVLRDKCVQCHDWQKTYHGLVDKKSEYSPTKGLLIVSISKPDSSVLIWRLNGQLPSGTSINSMPKFGTKLPAGTIQTFRDWITQGAPEKTSQVIEPPENVVASDVPTDQGHRIKITWKVSPSETDNSVVWYRIYRSRSSILTDPIRIDSFSSLDSLIFKEEHYTILIDSVTAGTTEYIDSAVPINGVDYYYWIQSAGANAASAKAVSSRELETYIENEPHVICYPPYPNPFNPSTTIGYTLPYEGHVTLIIYNISGQAVEVLKDEVQSAGTYSVVWNAVDMPNGLYFCTFKTTGLNVTRKLLLVK